MLFPPSRDPASPVEHSEQADLLARCALGDRAAFAALYRLSSAQLFAVALRMCQDRDLAADVLQEAFLRIWRRASDYRPDLASASTWMVAIVRHQAIDHLRRRQRGQVVRHDEDGALEAQPDPTPGPQQQSDAAQRAAHLHACLAQLEDGPRTVVQMAYLRGLSHEDIARECGTPLGTVKSWIRRALPRLRRCLET